ncbi:MAG: hypothetical protein J6A01_01550 [Proteobacteria bacterium]|nr:hypothetical protein [Pseudomonadota bacterium]
MKRSNRIIICAAAFSMTIFFASCKANKSDSTETQPTAAASAENAALEQAKADTPKTPEPANPSDAQPKSLPAYQFPGDDPIHKAISDYLTGEIAKNFDPSDVCIPSMTIVATDTSNPDDILVWGDFWIFNYKLENDTLLTQSGGSYPGLLHLKKAGETYTVSKMDQVADGSDNLQSAKKIFGDKYDDFHKINSNQDEREKVRRQFISDYVKMNKLPITKVKDFGWDPVELP